MHGNRVVLLLEGTASSCLCTGMDFHIFVGRVQEFFWGEGCNCLLLLVHKITLFGGIKIFGWVPNHTGGEG